MVTVLDQKEGKEGFGLTGGGGLRNGEFGPAMEESRASPRGLQQSGTLPADGRAPVFFQVNS